jgi:hypothetical protein
MLVLLPGKLGFINQPVIREVAVKGFAFVLHRFRQSIPVDFFHRVKIVSGFDIFLRETVKQKPRLRTTGGPKLNCYEKTG